MTDAEIEQVAKIALTADHWCTSCASELFEQLRAAFPAHLSVIERVWERREEIRSAFSDADLAWDEAGYPDGQNPKAWMID